MLLFHGDTVVSSVTSARELGLNPSCVEFACSSHEFTPGTLCLSQSKDLHLRLIGDSIYQQKV